MDYLSKLENQSIYILREAFNKFEKPRHALEHRQGFDRLALAGAQGVSGPRSLSAGPCGHDLQDSQHDRVSRPGGEGMETEIGGGEK